MQHYEEEASERLWNHIAQLKEGKAPDTTDSRAASNGLSSLVEAVDQAMRADLDQASGQAEARARLLALIQTESKPVGRPEVQASPARPEKQSVWSVLTRHRQLIFTVLMLALGLGALGIEAWRVYQACH